MEIYGNERAALDALRCIKDDDPKPPSLLTVDQEESDMEEVQDFIAKDARRKREEMQGDDYRTNYIDENGVLPQPTTQRGDIPSNGIETCDGKIVSG